MTQEDSEEGEEDVEIEVEVEGDSITSTVTEISTIIPIAKMTLTILTAKAISIIITITITNSIASKLMTVSIALIQHIFAIIISLNIVQKGSNRRLLLKKIFKNKKKAHNS